MASGAILAHVSSRSVCVQVATVLQAPYDKTSGRQTDAGEPSLADGSAAPDSSDDAAAATAKAGLDEATPNTVEGRQGAADAASGDAKLPEESAKQQRSAGLMARNAIPEAESTAPHPSPFASAAQPPRASQDGAEDDTQVRIGCIAALWPTTALASSPERGSQHLGGQSC